MTLEHFNDQYGFGQVREPGGMMRCEACGADSAADKAELERLQGLVKYHCEEQMKGWKKERALKALLTECADALETQPGLIAPDFEAIDALVERVRREATL